MTAASRRPSVGVPHAQRGWSVVELLVAMFVLVTVLAIASVFFARQIQLQRAVQARNDVQDRVRVVAQLVTQDLSLAGAQQLIRADGGLVTGFPECAQAVGMTLCVNVQNESDTYSTLRVRYVSSQFPTAEACRDVAYSLVGTDLRRSDVTCGGADAFVDIAPDMLGFKLVVVCSRGNRVASFGAGTCGADAFGRSALLSVGGASSIPVAGASPAVSFVRPDGATPPTLSVPCPGERICYGVTQEVLMPNLKDR